MAVSMIARSEITVNAAPARVRAALIDPKAIKEYFFGSDVTSHWTVGSEIVWEGEWQGKKYRDHGRILQLEPERGRQYTHFSSAAAAFRSELVHDARRTQVLRGAVS